MSEKEKVSIFSCERPEEFLQKVFEEKRALRPRYSMRQFAIFLGFSDSGTLSRILSGKRAISLSRVHKLAQILKLNSDEKIYFLQMTLLQDVSDEIRVPLLHSMRSLLSRLHLSESVGNPEQFNAIADYQYLAVRECLRLKASEPNTLNSLEKIWKVGPTPNFSEILEKLKRLGLIEEKEGEFELCDPRPFSISSEERSEAIRHYHSGWLMAAEKMLHSLPTEERTFHGSTISIPKWAYEEVSRRVSDLHKDLLTLSVAEDADQVIHIESFILPVTGHKEKNESK